MTDHTDETDGIPPSGRHGIRLWWRMLPEEPFRAFFPLGILAGLTGALHWPLHSAGIITDYPGIVHSRVMLQGFVFAFIIGFLGTAGPRMLEVDPASRGELGAILLLWCGTVALHLASLPLAGDTTFLLLLAWLLVMTAGRWPARRDLPPPDFVLVAGGILAGAAGTVGLMLIHTGAVTGRPAFILHTFAKLLLYEGLPLLPILGVAGFFFGRFSGRPPKEAQPGTRNPDRRYLVAALRNLPVVAAILLAFLCEAGGYVRTGTAVKCAAAALHLVRRIPWSIPPERPATLARIVRGAVLLLLLGWLLPLVDPTLLIAWRHVVLVAGAGLVIVSVSTWVTFAHAGRRDRAGGRLRGHTAIAGLFLVALLTRVWADVLPEMRESHLVYAAVALSGALLLWLKVLLPRVLEAEAD